MVTPRLAEPGRRGGGGDVGRGGWVRIEKVFGSKAPLATPLKTCIGTVSLFINACIHAAVISSAPAIKPAVNALAKNDFLIKVLVYIPDDKSRQFAAGI